MSTAQACPYCKEVNSYLRYSLRDHKGRCSDLRRCPVCHASFVSPLPSDVELREAYSETYYGLGVKKFPGPVGIIFDFLRSQRAKGISLMLPVGARALDIGCGSGVFLQALLKLGFECSGVELPGAAATRASKIEGIHLYLGGLESVELPENHFDFVMLWHVLEHLINPVSALEVVKRSTRQGGIVVVALPNIESIQSHLFRGCWFHLDPPRHLTFLPREALISQMRLRGFELIGERNFSFEYDPFGYQQSFLNWIGFRRDALYEVLKGNIRIKSELTWTQLFILRIFFIVSTPLAFALALGESALGKGGSLALTFQRRQ